MKQKCLLFGCWLFLLLCAGGTWAFAPCAACWNSRGTVYLAALDGQRVRVARVSGARIDEISTIPAPGVSLLVGGRWQKDGALLSACGRKVLRLEPATARWVTLGSAPAPIREMLPARGDGEGAVLLTGYAGVPVLEGGAVWWASWAKGFSCRRVSAVKDDFRPWQLCWAGIPGEEQLAVATYKSTRFAPFAHNCFFLFSWRQGTAEPRWLGSRLTRPYTDAACADLRGDGNWRLAAVEVTRTGGRGLSVYAPIQFGYAGEWHAEDQPGLQRVAAFGTQLICWGYDEHNHPRDWQLIPADEKYRLQELPIAPPKLESLTAVTANRLAGWWNGAWHTIELIK